MFFLKDWRPAPKHPFQQVEECQKDINFSLNGLHSDYILSINKNKELLNTIPPEKDFLSQFSAFNYQPGSYQTWKATFRSF